MRKKRVKILKEEALTKYLRLEKSIKNSQTFKNFFRKIKKLYLRTEYNIKLKKKEC